MATFINKTKLLQAEIKELLKNRKGEVKTIPANTSGISSIATKIVYEKILMSFEIVAAPFTEGQLTFKKSNRQLYDAPYKMFCIPVTADEAVVQVGETAVLTTKDKMLQIASSIATGLGSNLYDIQLLPYCPIEDQFAVMVGSRNGIEYVGGTEDIDYSVMRDDDAVIGYVF